MKTTLPRFALSLMLLLTGAVATAQDEFSIAVKLGVAPALESIDFQNIQISDGDPLGAAYLQVPFATHKPDGTPIALGVEVNKWFSPRFSAGLELDLATKGSTLGGSLLAAASFSVVGEMDTQFMLGVTAKLGMSYYVFDLGPAVITGIPPFSNGDKTIYAGDDLNGSISPLVYHLGVTARVKISDNLYLNLQPALAGAFNSAEVIVRCNGAPVNTVAGTGQLVNVGDISLMGGVEFVF